MEFHVGCYPIEDFIVFAQRKDGRWNGMTCGWAQEGELFGRPVLTLYIRKSRYTSLFLEESVRYLVARFEDPELLRYFGTVSGRDEDKMARFGLKVEEKDGVFSISGATEQATIRKMLVADLSKAHYASCDAAEEFREFEDPHLVFVGEIVRPEAQSIQL